MNSKRRFTHFNTQSNSMANLRGVVSTPRTEVTRGMSRGGTSVANHDYRNPLDSVQKPTKNYTIKLAPNYSKFHYIFLKLIKFPIKKITS